MDEDGVKEILVKIDILHRGVQEIGIAQENKINEVNKTLNTMMEKDGYLPEEKRQNCFRCIHYVSCAQGLKEACKGLINFVSAK
jgi:hypothetical protein